MSAFVLRISNFEFRACLLVAVILAGAPVASAADAPRVTITAARVGLPAVADDVPPVAKFAAWAPVYVDLRVDGAVPEAAELVVESPDADGVVARLAVPLDLAAVTTGGTLPARSLARFAYVRPAAGAADTTVTVRLKDGAAISAPFRVGTLRPRDPLTYVVLGLGSKLPGFELPRPGVGDTEQASAAGLRGGRVELTAITDFDLLPDQWIGYDAADLVVLTTTTGLSEKLFGANGGRKRAALLEWVRRGGRLVVSAGEQARRLTDPAAADFLPATLNADPTRSVSRVSLYWSAREAGATSTLSGILGGRGGPFPVASLTPAPGARVVVPPPARQTDDWFPLGVQGAVGLGRVTLIGFDLDRAPFTNFDGRADFWDWVLREGGAARASVGSEGKPRPIYTGPTDDEDELAVALRTHVDTFDGVPVISFGWVAVLVGFYLVLIGPVEYYLLKRVLGRLELTWLTFPLLVATVSVLAYLAAAAVKGRDLRVNAVEVLDVVPGGANARVYGTTWYGVFSPKISAYTVGVSPAPGLSAAGAGGDPVLGWIGGPRGGRASLLRRRYEVAGADGVAGELSGVPVPIWASRAVAANWSAPLDAAAPVVESRLEHPPGDRAKAVGTFVTRLPFPELTDAVAFYAGQAFPLGTLVPDTEVRLVLDRGTPVTQYLQDKAGLAELYARVPGADRTPGKTAPAAATGPTEFPMWGVLFHEAALRNDEGVIPRNASLRRLDQSWRLTADNRGEVIVVARVPTLAGKSADVTGGPESAGRLRLAAGARAPVTGVGRTETYVRVYLPVR